MDAMRAPLGRHYRFDSERRKRRLAIRTIKNAFWSPFRNLKHFSIGKAAAFVLSSSVRKKDKQKPIAFLVVHTRSFLST